MDIGSYPVPVSVPYSGGRPAIFISTYEFLAVDALSIAATFWLNEPHDLQLSDLSVAARLICYAKLQRHPTSTPDNCRLARKYHIS